MDWRSAHIVVTHHGYLREELPRLECLLDRVSSSCEDWHPVPGELRQAFRSMRAALEGLMLHEESHLFPFYRALEQARERPEALRETLDDAIRIDLCEHEDARRCLLRILELNQEFTPPAECCNSYRALVDGLASLEAELSLYLDEENCLLFTRARAAEAARASAPVPA